MLVPTQTPPPPSYSRQALRQMEAERKLVEHEKFTFWGVIWILFGFKIASIVVILIVGAGSPDWETGEGAAFIAMSSWYWLFIPIAAFSGAVAWRLRLRKQRKQAELLKNAEFSTMNVAELSMEERERLRQVPYLHEHER